MSTILSHDPARFRAARAAMRPDATATIYSALARLTKGADDPSAKPVLDALAKAAELRSSLPGYEAELRATGRFTESGIAHSMRAKRTEVRGQVEHLLSEVRAHRTKLPAPVAPAERKLPEGDSHHDERMVAWFNNLNSRERMHVLSRAVAGEDDALCAALARNERFIKQPVAASLWDRMQERAYGPAPEVPPAQLELAARHEIAEVAEQSLAGLAATFPVED